MSLKRKTLKHSLIYSIADLLSKIVSFLLLPLYARVFNTDGYGIVALVDSSIGLLSIAFAGCAFNTIMRIYHDEPAERKALAVGTSIRTMWTASLLCIPLPVLASPWIAQFLLGDRSYWLLVVVGLITFVVATGAQSANAFLVIRQRSVLYTMLGLFNMVLGISLNIFFVLYLQVGVIGVFWSSLIVSIINSIIVHATAIKEYGLNYDAEIARKMRAFWFPLIPGEIFAYLSRQAERYLVRFIIGLNGVGILEMGYKFAPLINIIISHPFMRAWGTKSMEIGADSEAPKEIATTFTLYMFLVLFGAVFLGANIDEILALMTPSQFWPAASIARIETVTTVIVAAWNYLQFGLLYSKLTSTISRIRIVTAVFKIVLSTVLVMTAGLAGAAYSALVMQVVITAWTFSRAQAAYHLPLEYCKLSALIVAAIAIAFIAQQEAVDINTTVVWLRGHLSTTLAVVIAASPLADWHSGILLRIVNDQAIYLARLLFSCGICASYGLLVLVVFPDLLQQARLKWLRIKIPG